MATLEETPKLDSRSQVSDPTKSKTVAPIVSTAGRCGHSPFGSSMNFGNRKDPSWHCLNRKAV